MCHCSKSTQKFHFLTPFSLAVELTLAVSCSVGGTWELKQMSQLPGLLPQRGEAMWTTCTSMKQNMGMKKKRRKQGGGKTDARSHPSQMQKETGQKVSVWI